jgi:NTE family protein
LETDKTTISNNTDNTTVSLVLGAGGARGMAHIGIIQWQERNGYTIRSISGASIGSLIGGVYALGKLPEFTGWVTALTKTDIIALLDVSVGRSGFVKGDRIIDALKQLVGDKLIEDLPISYTAVAADIVNEKEVWFSSGSLFHAIRASISLPIFFTPAKHGELELLDGGMLNPVPVAPTFRDETDITIAVNLAGARVKSLPPSEHHVILPPVADFKLKIEKYIENAGWGGLPKPERRMGMTDLIDLSFDTMQGAIARHKLAAYPPDIILEVPRNYCGTLEFDRAAEMIELGYDIADKTVKH